MASEREIDKLVAEKVMGWKWESFKDPDNFKSPARWLCRPDGLKIGEESLSYSNHLPHYSTNIADAKTVLDRYKALEPEMSWSDEDHCWVVVFKKHPATPTCDESLEKAIVLHCLKVEGVEVDDG